MYPNSNNSPIVGLVAIQSGKGRIFYAALDETDNLTGLFILYNHNKLLVSNLEMHNYLKKDILQIILNKKHFRKMPSVLGQFKNRRKLNSLSK